MGIAMSFIEPGQVSKVRSTMKLFFPNFNFYVENESVERATKIKALNESKLTDKIYNTHVGKTDVCFNTFGLVRIEGSN